MNESTSDLKTSTRVLLLLAAVMPVILLTGPLGYKFQLVDLQPSFASLLLAFVGGLVVFVVALVFVVIASRNNLARDARTLMVAMVIALIPAAIMLPTLLKGFSVPQIHDITTDTSNPPEFDVIVKRRVHALNGLEYGDDEFSAEQLAEMQQAAYPNVQPLFVERPVAELPDLVAKVLEQQGLEIANVDADNGRVEATATTFWFGFKDDLVVRLMPTESGARIDVRSVSRVGKSDLGANAARIEAFLAALQAAL